MILNEIFSIDEKNIQITKNQPLTNKKLLEKGVAEGFLNESAYEEAWELISQPVPEIQQFVKQLGLAQDDTTAKQIAPMIDATPDTQLPAASIPKLKNLANKGNDVQTLKAIQQISGRPDAAQQYAKIMQARDAGEGRQRGYDVSGLINSVKSGNYEAPVLLKLATGTYVIGGRTRLYAALALGIPAKVKIISVSTFAKQGQQGVAEGSLEEGKLGNIVMAFAIAGGALIGGVAGVKSHLNQQRWMAAYERIKEKDPATAEQIRLLVKKYKTEPLKFGPDVYTSRKIDKIITDFEKQKLDEQGVSEGSEKTFTVVYYSKKTDRNVSKQIKASSESELWDRLRAKGIDVVSIKEQSVAEGGAETSWSHGTDTVTLQDILELTKHIKQINLPINDQLKSKLIHWDGNPEEIERINQVTVSSQFPILVMLDQQGQIAWILDGNHRLHKAIKSQAKTIPAKLIKPSDLDDKAKRVLHIAEQGVAEGLRDPKDNPCWKGYKPVGTKKKNGRTVPNCVPVKENNQQPEKLNRLVKETIDNLNQMLKDVKTRNDTWKIQRYIDQQFQLFGNLTEGAKHYKNHLIQQITQIAATRRREMLEQTTNTP